MKHLFVWGALLLLPLFNVRADKADDVVRREMEKQHIPGVSLAVVQDGRIIKAQGYGLANIELGVPVNPATAFAIGSVSKQFLATGIMMLVQEGRLAIEDPVSKYIDGTPPTWAGIKIRHFLTHTSGVVRESPTFDPAKLQPDIDVIRGAFKEPLRFPTGSKYEYCNVGYFSLAEIISRVSGMPWPEFFAKRIFGPLGMSASRTTSLSDVIPNRADAYDYKDGEMHKAVTYLALRPSGAFISTVLDLAKWDAALDGEAFLTKASKDQMWTPTKLTDGTMSAYGFAWQIGTLNGHREIAHGGSLPGSKSHFARYVDDGLSVIVLSNEADANPTVIARGVAEVYLKSK